MGRNKVLEYPKPFIQWPATSEELADGNIDLLDLLTTFLVHFMQYNGKTSTHTNETVNSIGQKIPYN